MTFSFGRPLNLDITALRCDRVAAFILTIRTAAPEFEPSLNSLKDWQPHRKSNEASLCSHDLGDRWNDCLMWAGRRSLCLQTDIRCENIITRKTFEVVSSRNHCSPPMRVIAVTCQLGESNNKFTEKSDLVEKLETMGHFKRHLMARVIVNSETISEKALSTRIVNKAFQG